MKDSGLKDKIALVTGANHGIGAATAQALAAEGAAVFMTYLRLHQQNTTGSWAGAGEEDSVPGEALYHARQAVSADHVVQPIRERGGCAVAWEADLATPTTVPELFDRVEDTLGPVDVLVNSQHERRTVFQIPSCRSACLGRRTMLLPVSAPSRPRATISTSP
jgi:3-oxoacyl-[acyl-carrier protein] reductase